MWIDCSDDINPLVGITGMKKTLSPGGNYGYEEDTLSSDVITTTQLYIYLFRWFTETIWNSAVLRSITIQNMDLHKPVHVGIA